MRAYISRKMFREELKLLKKFPIYTKIGIKGYKRTYTLVFFSIDHDEKTISIRLARHGLHNRYLADLKMKIKEPCNHLVQFENPRLEVFEKRI